MDWSHLAYRLPSKRPYSRKDRKKDLSDEKTKKKT